MDEDRLERVAKTLGARAADRLDVERVAARVVARLRADGAQAARLRRAWWSAPAVLQLAAALAVLVTGGVLVRGALENGSEPAAVVAPILRDLSADELAEVFDSLSIEAPVHEGVAVGLESLNEAQLNELLRLMEG
jgi:hypothetical protein